MARKINEVTVEDPEGEAWHSLASARWSDAVAEARARGRRGVQGWDAPPLPDFRASVPIHVTREILGRFLQDRDSGTVHDCYAAVPECRIDGIANGTFFHFWSEVVADLQEDQPCSLCIP